MKNKKPIIALAALVAVGLVGATIAYFTSEVTLDNVFTTATYKTKTTETFSSPTDWLPGTTTPKTVVTENEGTIPVVARASLAENWKNEQNQDVAISDYRDYTTINFTNIGTGNNEWTLHTDGKYYFNRQLAAKSGDTVDSTSTFIESVTLNANVASSQTCTETGTIGQGTYTKTCTTGIDGIGKGTYTLTITIETVQADKCAQAWTGAPTSICPTN